MKINNLFNSKLSLLFLIVGLILICIPIVFWKYIIEYRENDKQKLILEYPLLINVKKEIRGKIATIRISNYYSGTSLYYLSNEEKFRLSGLTINYDYNKLNNDLMNMLSVGDSIYKPANSDSIYVYRKDKKFYFILGKKIN